MREFESFLLSKKNLLTFILLSFGLFCTALFVKEIFLINEIKQKTAPNSISVSAQGKITANNNIAKVSLGVLSESLNIASAQDENTKKVNNIIKLLKVSNVKEEDIKLQDYSIYPRYDYTNGKQKLVAYDISQSLSVKIRDLAKIGDILKGAGQEGVNQVGSLEFTIDDPEKLESQALQKAIQAAKEKAHTLAGNLNISLGRATNFTESSDQIPIPRPYFDAKNTYGVGGATDTAPIPEITPGQNEITKTVTITFEIK